MFTGNNKAILIAYLNTHILFNPYYHRMRTPKILLETIKTAQARHMLDAVDNFIFVRFFQAKDENLPFIQALPVSNLMACKMLNKQVITLSENFKLVIVAKQAFFDKAETCLKEYPAMQNLVEPLPMNIKVQ